MSPGTVRALGSHVWEASLDRRGDRSGKFGSKEVVGRLVWAELDLYEYQQIEGGSLALEERQIDNDRYRRTSAGAPWQLSRAASGDSTVLMKPLSLWNEALRPLGEQVAWTRQDDTTVEGRPARVYKLQMAPLTATDSASSPADAARRKGLSMIPLAVEGIAYIDDETGNRLLAELEIRFVPRVVADRADPLDEVLVTYRESRSITPLPPDIVEPDPETVRVRGDISDRAKNPYPKPTRPGERR